MNNVIKVDNYLELIEAAHKRKENGEIRFEFSAMTSIEFERAKSFIEGFTAMHEADLVCEGRSLTYKLDSKAFWPMNYYKPTECIRCNLLKLSDKSKLVDVLSNHVKKVTIDMSCLSAEDQVRAFDYIQGVAAAVYAFVERIEEDLYDFVVWKKPMVRQGKKDYKKISENHVAILELYNDFECNFDMIEALYKESIALCDKNHIIGRFELEYIEALTRVGRMADAIRAFDMMRQKFWENDINDIGFFSECNRLLERGGTYKDPRKVDNAINVYNKLIHYMVKHEQTTYLSFMYNFLVRALLEKGSYHEAKKVAEKALEFQSEGKIKLESKMLYSEVCYKLGLLKEAVEIAEACLEELDINNKGEFISYMRQEEFISDFKNRV